MTTFALMPWRRVSAQGGLWNLFAWFGRACDQAAGILVSPIIVAVFARSVQADPYRLSWLVVGFGLGWLIGAAIAPLLQQVTVRIMPWIVGGYIVRTAAIVLMTFAVTDDQSSQTQRFQSILICYVAYAIATGISRTAQARHVIVGAPHNLWDARSLPATLGSAAVTAIAALAMWSALSSSDLSWSASFGRIWILASVALGVATLAAIREGIEMPEMAADSHRRATQSECACSGRAVWRERIRSRRSGFHDIRRSRRLSSPFRRVSAPDDLPARRFGLFCGRVGHRAPDLEPGRASVWTRRHRSGRSRLRGNRYHRRHRHSRIDTGQLVSGSNRQHGPAPKCSSTRLAC